MAVRSVMAASSSSRVSTQTTLAPVSSHLRLVAGPVGALLDHLVLHPGRVGELPQPGVVPVV